MSKILLLILAGIVVWWLLKGTRAKPRDKSQEEAGSERMVVCSHCGVYLPQHEAIRQPDGNAGPAAGQSPAGGRDEKFYCSEEHRRLAG